MTSEKDLSQTAKDVPTVEVTVKYNVWVLHGSAY